MWKKRIVIIGLAVILILLADLAVKNYQNSKKYATNISLAEPRTNVPAGAPKDGGFGVFSIPVPEILSRSGQPSLDEFKWLKNNGWKSIISLRVDGEKDDAPDPEIPGFNDLGLIYLNIPVKDGDTPSQEQAAQFLKFVTDPKNQPVHIHCNAGTGRTGLMTALYRYAVESWPMDKALEEKASFGSNNKVQKKWLEKWAATHAPGSYAK